jgi:hypothetical protein
MSLMSHPWLPTDCQIHHQDGSSSSSSSSSRQHGPDLCHMQHAAGSNFKIWILLCSPIFFCLLGGANTDFTYRPHPGRPARLKGGEAVWGFANAMQGVRPFKSLWSAHSIFRVFYRPPVSPSYPRLLPWEALPSGQGQIKRPPP